MITNEKAPQIINNVYAETTTYYGLSTDSKPTTGVGNGSCFIEMDSGKVCFFDAASLNMVAFEEGSYTFTDVSEYMSMIPSTLTIYWHPMPSGS